MSADGKEDRTLPAPAFPPEYYETEALYVSEEELAKRYGPEPEEDKYFESLERLLEKIRAQTRRQQDGVEDVTHD